MGSLLPPFVFIMAALSTKNCITAQTTSPEIATAPPHITTAAHSSTTWRNTTTPAPMTPKTESQKADVGAATAETPSNMATAGTPSNMATAGTPSNMATAAQVSTQLPVLSTRQTTKLSTGVPKRPSNCCFNENMVIMLQKDHPVLNGYVPFVSVVEQTNGTDTAACDAKVLLKATFRKSNQTVPCQGCTNVPQCGNQMLKIELWMSPNKTGVSFHVGDSITNDGYGGDESTQENDAEFHLYNYEQRLYGSDKCVNMSQLLFSLPNASAHWVTIYIGNEFIRVSTPLGDAYELCSDCLFALNGQSDSQGTVNEDIYIGLNRIIRSSNLGGGNGVCGAVISWACPWKV